MFDRRKAILSSVAVVVIAAVVYGVYLAVQPKNPYAGMTTWRDTQIDEATRFTLEQRIATTKSAIATTIAAEEDVDTALYLSLAQDAYILGDLITAREALDVAINQNSLNSAVWNTYGNIASHMGDLEVAERAYQQAIDLGENSEYYMDYVRFLQKYYPERNEDIRSILEHGINRIGRNAQFMVALGEWYWEAGDCTRAIDHYEVALSLNPANEGINATIQEIRTTCVQSK